MIIYGMLAFMLLIKYGADQNFCVNFSSLVVAMQFRAQPPCSAQGK